MNAAVANDHTSTTVGAAEIADSARSIACAG